MALSISKEFWYFAIAADKDISADVARFALDRDSLVAGAGIVGAYTTPAALPPNAAARNTAGLYWYSVQSGPGWATDALPLVVGDNTVYCQVADNPEIPVFHWVITATD